VGVGSRRRVISRATCGAVFVPAMPMLPRSMPVVSGVDVVGLVRQVARSVQPSTVPAELGDVHGQTHPAAAWWRRNQVRWIADQNKHKIN
jgi:hypothetical protein